MAKREWTKSTKYGWLIYESWPYSIQREIGTGPFAFFYEGDLLGTDVKSLKAAKDAIEQHAKDNQ